MESREEKGDWAETADEGVVPDELGRDAEGEGPEGRVTGSDEPATEEGVDLSAGDEADATSDGGVELPDDAEPDVKDAMGAHNRPDADAGD